MPRTTETIDNELSIFAGRMAEADEHVFKVMAVHVDGLLKERAGMVGAQMAVPPVEFGREQTAEEQINTIVRQMDERAS